MAEGLRQRKKRATVNAIEGAGVRLSLEKGFKNVTVQEICDDADISRSTFFNYMPSREAAIFGRPVRLVPEEYARAVFAELGEKSMLTAVLHVSDKSVGGVEINQDVAAGRTRLREEQPECLPFLIAPMTAFSLELTTFLAGWLNEHPEQQRLSGATAEREASHIVTIAMGAFTAIMGDMNAGGDESFSLEEVADIIGEMGDVAKHLKTAV